jgi:hypothetical protein
MDLDPRPQRASERVEPVKGSICDPGEGRVCLMSLVAFLAGEPHSDAPRCASALYAAEPMASCRAVAAVEGLQRITMSTRRGNDGEDARG